MKPELTFGALLREPSVQVYLVGCLLSLGLIALIEMARGYLVLVLLAPVLMVIGVLGIFAHFSSSPIMILLALAGGELHARHSRYGGGAPREFLLWGYNPLDVLLCLAVLSYLLCQFRLHTLTSNLLPRDPRQRRELLPKRPVPYARRRRLVQKRDPKTFTWAEGIVVLLTLLGWTVAAVLLYSRLLVAPNYFGFPDWANRLLLLLWVSVGLVLLGISVLGYWRWCTWSADEALLVLQDSLWRETRREQTRQSRWLAWARRRGKYRKEKP